MPSKLTRVGHVLFFILGWGTWQPNAVAAQGTSLAPVYAAAAGYIVNTFSSEFDPSSVDSHQSEKKGYAWYLWNFFGQRADSRAIDFNRDHSVTLNGDTTGPNGELATAIPANNEAGFVGTAFGGGAYIEAVFKFDPADVARAKSNGWPSFWSLPMEGGIFQGRNQWPGQPAGYNHHIEADFFEYLLLANGEPRNSYGASLHDWYGIPGKTCQPLCQVGMPYRVGKRVAPSDIDFTTYHRFGFLWVPATATTPGYARFYLDGQPVGPDQRWELYTNQPPPPTNRPWAFGIIDQQHLILILGTGLREPFTIQSVNVWQTSSAHNISN